MGLVLCRSPASFFKRLEERALRQGPDGCAWLHTAPDMCVEGSKPDGCYHPIYFLYVICKQSKVDGGESRLLQGTVSVS